MGIAHAANFLQVLKTEGAKNSVKKRGNKSIAK